MLKTFRQPVAVRQSSARHAGDRARDAHDWATAVEHYQEHLTQAADDAAIWVQLGNCAKESGDFTTSQAAYARALELEPETADTHLQLGHLFKLMRRPRSALQSFRNAMARNPALADARHEVVLLERAAMVAPFLLEETYLDLLEAATLEQLIARAERADTHDDPFRLFATLITGREDRQ